MKGLTKVIVTAVLLPLPLCQGQGQHHPDASQTRNQQPPDLHLVLSTKEGRTQFHLGEIIEMEEAYSSDSTDKYLLLTVPTKIQGGHSAQVTIQPNEHVIDRTRDGGYMSADSILHVNCGGGTGGGFGGSCFDCDRDMPLNSHPIRFPYALTAQFQILEPGHYSIRAEAASVVRAPLDRATSAPIALTSNIVEIEVADDPAWSREKLWDTLSRFDSALWEYVGKGWDTTPTDKVSVKDIPARTELELKIRQAAETLRVLDTEDSLTEIVRRYAGVQHGPDYFQHILYAGIIQSKHRPLAVKLLADRILDPDFSASTSLIDQLTAMALQDQFPDDFSRGEDASRRRLYPIARAMLREYVLALGKSLPEKNPGALESSLRAFKTYATEDFCTGEPLIPGVTFQQLLRQVQAFDAAAED